MNKKLIIALIVAGAALLAFFILSTPANPATQPAGGSAGLPNAPNPSPTGTGANVTVNPSVNLGTNTPNPGLSGSSALSAKDEILKKVVAANANPKPDDWAQEFKTNIPSIGWVKIFSKWGDIQNWQMFLVESTGNAYFPGTSDWDQLKAAIMVNVAAMKKRNNG